jgi:hypothetical protein|eukprot:5887046-Pyramimonas_sp.AAC.1
MSLEHSVEKRLGEARESCSKVEGDESRREVRAVPRGSSDRILAGNVAKEVAAANEALLRRVRAVGSQVT